MSEKYRTNAFFNGVSTFKTAFPDLQDATIEWREKQGPYDERNTDLRKTGYRRGNFTHGLLQCSNPDCHEGGYQVDRLIADMLAVGETEREGILLCTGREVGEEARRGPVRCPHRIAYRATIVPRAAEQPAPAPSRPRPNQNRRGRGRGPRRRDVA